MLYAKMKHIVILLLAVVASGCTYFDPDENSTCVAADDWGYPKVWVPSSASDLVVYGDRQQSAEPIDSGQVLIDAERVPLIMTLGKYGQWTSWFGADYSSFDTDSAEYFQGLYSDRRVPDIECTYRLLSGPPPGDPINDITPEFLKANRYNCAQIDENENYFNCLAPCYFRHGMGLYVGFANNNGSANDVLPGFTYHIPDVRRPEIAYDDNLPAHVNMDAQHRDIDGYLVRGMPNDIFPGVLDDDRLYFKIVDTYYEDNAGGYLVNIKEGTRDPEPGPVEYIVSVFIDPLRVIMERLYRGLTDNQGFIDLVRAALVIYIIFYGYMYMMGTVEDKKKEAYYRVIKIALIVQLISPNSFDFFYNHFFAFFYDGVLNIATLLLNPFEDFDADSPWYSVDALLKRLFSLETNAKVLSLLYSNALGFLFIIVYYIALIIFIFALARTLFIFVGAFVITAFLIAIAPIFITFLLFGKLKSFFDDWLNHLISVALQEIILLAALGLFIGIIVHFLEQSVGFSVCWNTYFELSIFGLTIFDFSFWTPDISTEQAFLWLDANNNGVREIFEDGSFETAFRYIDLPYFDPEYDGVKISRYLSEKNFIDIGDILLFGGAIFLMHNFMKFVPAFSESLKNTLSSADTVGIVGSGSPGSKLYASLQGITIGKKNSAAGLRGGNELTKMFYNNTGRSGGVLGTVARSGASLGRKYQDVGKFLSKQAKDEGKKASDKASKAINKADTKLGVSQAARGKYDELKDKALKRSKDLEDRVTQVAKHIEKEIGGNYKMHDSEFSLRDKMRSDAVMRRRYQDMMEDAVLNNDKDLSKQSRNTIKGLVDYQAQDLEDRKGQVDLLIQTYRNGTIPMHDFMVDDMNKLLTDPNLTSEQKAEIERLVGDYEQEKQRFARQLQEDADAALQESGATSTDDNAYKEILDQKRHDREQKRHEQEREKLDKYEQARMEEENYRKALEEENRQRAQERKAQEDQMRRKQQAVQNRKKQQIASLQSKLTSLDKSDPNYASEYARIAQEINNLQGSDE